MDDVTHWRREYERTVRIVDGMTAYRQRGGQGTMMPHVFDEYVRNERAAWLDAIRRAARENRS